MPERVKVIDKESGAESFVRVDEFDPAAHEIVPDQVATVAPLGGDEFAVGQEVTERSLTGGALLEQLSPEARAGLTAEQVEASTFDTTTNIAEQAARGVASGLSLGLSEVVLAEDDPFERERERRQRSAASGTFAIGEAVGGIAPALLSGGTGAAGSLARLTVPGRLAANSARFISGSKGLASRALRTVGTSALEGGVELVGNQIANEMIQNDPDLSAEAIASTFALGGIIGGGVAGVGEVLGAGFRQARRIGETPVERFERGLSGVSEFTTAPRGPVRPTMAVGDVVGREARGQADDTYRALATHIDDTSTAAFGAATQDAARLTSQVDDIGLPDSLAHEIRSGLQDTANRHLDAGNRTRSWLSEVADEVGVPPSKVTAKHLDDIPEDLEDRGIGLLAELDETGANWQRASVEVEGGLAEALASANQAAATGRPANVAGRFQAIADKIRGGTIGGGVTTAIGAAETARDLGVDIPVSVRDIPGVGQGLRLYSQLKTFSRATGVVPITSATRAARKVATVRDAIPAAIRGATRRAASLAARPIVRKLSQKTARAAAREILDIRRTTPAEVEASAHAAIDAPIAVKQAAVRAAVRAHEYLSTVAPRNPLEGTPAESAWVPTEQEQLDWTARRDAVRNPMDAIRTSMGGGFPDLAIEALREVYPRLYEDTRARIQGDAAKLQKRLPAHQLQSIGRVYQLPLTLAQTPGYGAAAQAAFAQGAAADQEAQGRFAAQRAPLRPINPGTSAVSELQSAPMSRQM